MLLFLLFKDRSHSNGNYTLCLLFVPFFKSLPSHKSLYDTPCHFVPPVRFILSLLPTLHPTTNTFPSPFRKTVHCGTSFVLGRHVSRPTLTRPLPRSSRVRTPSSNESQRLLVVTSVWSTPPPLSSPPSTLEWNLTVSWISDRNE